MLHTLILAAGGPLVLATEGGIPTSNPWSQLAVPLGIVIFVGAVYMLIRSNLGTRRGYLVMSTSLWGFTFLLSLFWTFGAPGTPPNTGPQNLPGQELDEYQPVWVSFAADSAVVTEDGSPYAAAARFPDGWGPVPDDVDPEAALTEITGFFGGLQDQGYSDVLFGTEVVLGEPLYAVAENGRPMIGATYVPSCQFDENGELVAYCAEAGLEVGDPIPEDTVNDSGTPLYTETTLFAFFDAGAPYFPSLVMTGITFVLFAFHMLLLYRDEVREAREAAEDASEEAQVEERATVGV